MKVKGKPSHTSHGLRLHESGGENEVSGITTITRLHTCCIYAIRPTPNWLDYDDAHPNASVNQHPNISVSKFVCVFRASYKQTLKIIHQVLLILLTTLTLDKTIVCVKELMS